MELIRQDHEILSVERPSGAVVRRHHTMYAHVALSAPAMAAPNVSIAVNVSLVKWDDGSPIADEDRSIDVYVNNVKVDTIATVAGLATWQVTFADAGTYVIEARNVYAKSATVEVIVA